MKRNFFSLCILVASILVLVLPSVSAQKPASVKKQEQKQISAQDSIQAAQKQEKKEKSDQRNKEIKEKGKETGLEIKEDLKETGEKIKEEGKETWSRIKESAKEWKEEAEGFFNKQIKSNVVGAFSNSRRQDNQDFCLVLLQPFTSFKMQSYSPTFPNTTSQTTKGKSLTDSSLKANPVILPEGVRMLSPITPPSSLPFAEGELVESAPLQLHFYGLSLKLDFEPRLFTYGIGTPNEKNLSKFWQKLSESRFDIPLKQIYELKKQVSLNDWGLYRLLCLTSEKIYPNNKNGEQAVWTVFMLNQAGYAAKIGRLSLSEKESKLVVMLPVYEKLYGIPVVEIEGATFYIFEKLSSKQRSAGIYSYEALPSMSTAPLSLQIEKPSALAKLYERDGKFTFDMRLVEFYKTYPSVPTGIYLHTPYGEILEKSIRAYMQPALDSVRSSCPTNETAQVAMVCFLRDFTSQYFNPDARPKNYAEERALFPEEAFAYMAGNKKDKAIILAQLLKKFTPLSPVIVEYDHDALVGIAAADLPGINEKTQTHYLILDQQKYYLLNPSAKTTEWGMIPATLIGKYPLVIK